MDFKIGWDHVSLEHKGQEINVRLDRYGDEEFALYFEYQGIRIHKDYEGRPSKWQSISSGICKLIDKIGAEQYKKQYEHVE